MTPTEIIATRLFGWQPHTEDTEHDAYEHFRIWSDGKPYCSMHRMPDFDDEIRQYYWVHRMEEELRSQGVVSWLKYAEELKRQVLEDRNPNQIIFDADLYLCATTAQRLEAACRVLEEVAK